MLKQTARSRYLLLGFCLDTAFEGQDDAPPAVVCTTGYNSANLLAMNLRHEREAKSFKGLGEWRIVIEVERNDRPTARHVFNAFDALFTHVHHGRIEDLSLELLPSKTISGREIDRSKVVAHCQERDRHKRLGWLARSAHSRINSFFRTTDMVHAFVLYQLPAILATEWLFSACTFFQASCKDFEFTGDSIGNLVRERSQKPELERDRQNLEAVVLNSFRTVEAISGEPGKDRSRFRERLASRGINYDERVGFSGTRRRAVGDVIYALQELRDSTSAHGVRRRKHPVTWFEAMNAQHLAESILHQALWVECCRLGRPAGSDEEIAYLLNQMYPWCSGSDWLSRGFRQLGGKNPVDMTRVPGGPREVAKFAEELRKEGAPARPKSKGNVFVVPKRG